MNRSENSNDHSKQPTPVGQLKWDRSEKSADASSRSLATLRFGWTVVKVVWASPNSILGICVGGVGLVVGTRIRFREGCLEFWGGSVTWMLRRLPISPAAMTLGHVVLGIDEANLHRVGPHERIHVRQYERWGPLFLPAYGLASWWAWRRGLNAYLDNPFEVEAYADDARRAALEATLDAAHKH